MALQQQINQQKHDKSPIRSHQIELAATDPSSRLNIDDSNTHYWALQRSVEKHASRSPKRENLKQLEDLQVRKSHQLKSQMPPVLGQVHFEEANNVRESIGGSTQIQRASHHFESTHWPND